jgi:hypothetical protein
MDPRGLSLIPWEAVRVAAVALLDLDDLPTQPPDVVQRGLLILILHDHLQFHNFLGRQDNGNYRFGEIQVHRSYPNLTERSDRIYYTPVWFIMQ